MILQQILFFVLLIFLKGVFTSAETALGVKERKGVKPSEGFSEESDNIFEKKISKVRLQIATMSIINVIIVMGLGFLCTSSFVSDISNCILGDNILINKTVTFCIFFVIIVVLLTYLTVLFGSIIPKRIANKNYEAVLKATKIPIELMYYVFYVFTQLMNFSVSVIDLFFDTSPTNAVTQEEIINLINEGEEKGAIDENEKEMINNIFEFDDKTAGDIATHRKEIVALPIDCDVEDVIKTVMEEKYSRIPVYKENIDNIVGILHIKDVLKYLVLHEKDSFNLEKLLMKPFFVPFSKKTDELFEQMQKSKLHMSIVIDEYGGTAGLVTMEDLIEEIMGNILDEYDEEEFPEIRRLNESIFMLKGTAELSEVEEEMDISFESDEYDTIGGFLVSKIDKIPEDNENYTVEFGGYIFSTVEIDEKRISLIRAQKILEDEDDGEIEEM